MARQTIRTNSLTVIIVGSIILVAMSTIKFHCFNVPDIFSDCCHQGLPLAVVTDNSQQPEVSSRCVYDESYKLVEVTLSLKCLL